MMQPFPPETLTGNSLLANRESEKVSAPPAGRSSTSPEVMDAGIILPTLPMGENKTDEESSAGTLVDTENVGYLASFLSKYHSLAIVLFFGGLVMPGCILALLICWFFPKLNGEKPVKIVGGLVLCSMTLLEVYLSVSYAMTFWQKNGVERRPTAFAVWAGLTGITFCVLLTSMLFVSALVKAAPPP